MPEVQDPYKGKHSHSCDLITEYADECDCQNYYNPWRAAAKRVVVLEGALNLCAAQVGAEDPAEGCRRVIKTVNEVLHAD